MTIVKNQSRYPLVLLVVALCSVALGAFISTAYWNIAEDSGFNAIQKTLRQCRLFGSDGKDAEMIALKEVVNKLRQQRDECSQYLNSQTEYLHQMQCNVSNQVK